MAKDADNPFEEEQPEASKGSASFVQIGIRVGLMVVVLAIGSAAGYSLGGLLGGTAPADANQGAEPADYLEEALPPEIGGDDFEYVDFEPITVNLNEKRLARYIRATMTLAIRKADASEARSAIEKKKNELRNWLTIYLSGLTLEEVRGPKSLNRIRREIQERCNEQLWPKRRPFIDQVLFKEFAIQ